MTQRTESTRPTAIETATKDTLESIRYNALHFHKEYEVQKHQQIDQAGFLRILALYFEHKTLKDWCDDLGIPDATDPADKP
jgi:hypothetical protein